MGRNPELEAIEGFLQGVTNGPRALVLEGAPGIGKTRLWLEARERARTRGLTVLSARPSGADVQLGFGGLADLLDGAGGEPMSELPAPQRRALRVALLLEEPGTIPPDERAVAAAFLAVLRRLAAAAPVVLAVDDLQWLDGATARILDYALRRLDSARAGILATVRSPEPPAVDVEGALGETTERLTLGPLSVAALHQIVKARLDLSLSRPTLLRVHETSQGNPFFALELARAIVAEEVEPTPGEPLPVPHELERLLLERLSRLSSRTLDVLLVAAAATQPTVDLLTRATGAAHGVVDEAVAAGVIELARDRVRFTHPLLAATRYAAASQPDRRSAHARLAAASGDGEERARHLARAAAEPDARVARALERAAAGAQARGAVAAAAELAEQAVELTPSSRVRELHRRRLAAARYAFAAGDTPWVEATLDDALRAAPAGPARAEVLRELGNVRSRTRDTRVALELYREAAVEARDDPALRASILCGLASAAWFWGDVEERRRAAEEAVVLAERVGDPLLLRDALVEHGQMTWRLSGGVPHEVMSRAEALERREARPVLRGAVYAYARMLVDAGDHAEARRRLEWLCERGREAGDVAVADPLFELGALEWDVGNWDRAEALMHEASELVEQSGWEVVAPTGVLYLAMIEGLRGDLEGGRARALEALELTERTGRLSGGPRGVLGEIELAAGRYAEAYAALEPALERYHARGSGGPMMQESCAVDALAALGRIDEARELLEHFEGNARRVRRAWALAAAARGRGVVAAAEGELESAAHDLREAVTLGRAVGIPLELGKSLLALGTVERRLRRKREARATLTRARDVFDGLGAVPWSERARDEISRIGGRKTAAESLSATETHIAELVRAGRTNREVAAELHLSAKTVEWNLSKIYRKLGVRSRTELAALREQIRGSPRL